MKKYEIDNLKNDKERYERYWKQEQDKNSALEEKNKDLTKSLNLLSERSYSEVYNLKEIIRWHINPETAKTPKLRTDVFGNEIH